MKLIRITAMIPDADAPAFNIEITRVDESNRSLVDTIEDIDDRDPQVTAVGMTITQLIDNLGEEARGDVREAVNALARI